MKADTVLRAWLQAARRRRIGVTTCAALPWAAVLATAVARWGSIALAAAVAAITAAAVVAGAWSYARRLDTRWLARRLNDRRADMDDSADLLFAADAPLSPLQRLQQARLRERIERGATPDLREPWPWRRIAAGAVVAGLLLAALLWWPTAQDLPLHQRLAEATGLAPAPTHTRLLQAQLAIAPPAYTRLPARTQDELDAKTVQGASLRWTLRLSPQPQTAALAFHDGRRVVLQRSGEDWIGQSVLDKPALYRLELDARALPLQTRRLYRLDATPDRAPQLRVIEPDRGLSLMQPGQRAWPLAFEASDDYGVDAGAQLRVVLAQGSGENITFRERQIALQGSGGAQSKRYVHRLDLGALGYAVGDDLIVQLMVHDNRRPQAQSARSPSLILRWPADAGSEATGIEGLVKTVLPAYFRSQRQIIIDAEALLAQRRRLDADTYLKRSDGIGVDQRILRLRYGQFLGEEAEGEPQLPTNDAEEEGAHEEGEHHDGDGHDHATAPKQDGHDHGQASASEPAKFGDPGSVLEQYGHTHDHAEAATLLDPETRKLLKSALDEMWQSELHLRQGHPDQALPYAYKALRYIKQVQQASRIYLARVGPELPPIDEGRRLSGDRAGLARRGDALSRADTSVPTLEALWRTLDAAPGSEAAAIDTAALERWLRDNETRVADPLALVAAIDALRERPDCADCRARLRGLLWPLLPRPPAAVPRRGDGGEEGRRYLDALRRERAP
ncbi:hypothetical protein [Lysobacter silvisoli]|uniref:DUF4175 domain-containing protein n=1 Tax=Lysobacter silvisoli TaxID=2293254 RepID=A0A371K755_9GAMM|nr:hypothetical protein [Lysobacter silvisoli]RDZ29694.1 hypothetical protein DX914_04670 [Lysobacter silvisoli]